MNKVKLLPHQKRAMQMVKGFQNVAYYLDMGSGKTFIGSEQMKLYGSHVNLVICQKSKVPDWVKHFETYYDYSVWDLTKRNELVLWKLFDGGLKKKPCVLIINYELAYRRPDLSHLEHFTMMLDESSMIQNERAKRSKFVLQLHPDHVILLSGTPTSGKYEKLWSQLRLLGWGISKRNYYDQFIIQKKIEISGMQIPIVVGYKNVDRLKRKLKEYGAVFMKMEDFGINLPGMNEIIMNTKEPAAYKRFLKERVIEIQGNELIGDTSLTMRLYLRQICGQYSKSRIRAVKDLIESTEDRMIVFYNFNAELDELLNMAESLGRPVSVVNGKKKDLKAYESEDDSITLIQYQAGAMGLNLQKANKIIYFTLPDKSELFEQSKARIHRIGQTRPCFYYYMMSPRTIEEDVLETLKMRKDYTDELFRKSMEGKR